MRSDEVLFSHATLALWIPVYASIFIGSSAFYVAGSVSTSFRNLAVSSVGETATLL